MPDDELCQNGRAGTVIGAWTIPPTGIRPLFSLASPMNRREEVRKADVECSGKLRDRANVNIPFPAFDVPDGIPMQVGTFCQCFLR